MKLKDYIKLLEALPQDAEVYTMYSNDWGDFIEVAGEPYYGKELFTEHYVLSETKSEYREGVIINIDHKD